MKKADYVKRAEKTRIKLNELDKMTIHCLKKWQQQSMQMKRLRKTV